MLNVAFADYASRCPVGRRLNVKDASNNWVLGGNDMVVRKTTELGKADMTKCFDVVGDNQVGDDQVKTHLLWDKCPTLFTTPVRKRQLSRNEKL